MFISIDVLGCPPLLPYNFYVIIIGNTAWSEISIDKYRFVGGLIYSESRMTVTDINNQVHLMAF
jgi:hypothetical protein